MSECPSNRKILLIDDEPSALKMLRLILSALKYTVFTAESGEEGLETFRKKSPTLVLTDIRMPGMDGIEVLKRLKEIDPKAEVIVVTGHGDMELAIQALQHNASDFINKPIGREALEVALRRAEEKIALRRKVDDYTQQLEIRVQEATRQLEKSCQWLKTLYEISQSLSGAVSLTGMLGLLREQIQAMTQLKPYSFLVLHPYRNSLLKGAWETLPIRAWEDLLCEIRKLDKPRALSPEECSRLFPQFEPLETEWLALAPIGQDGEPSVGASVLGIPQEGGGDDLCMAVLLLTQATGAIRRAAIQEEEVQRLRQAAQGQNRFGDLVGRHEKMQQIYRLATSVADSDATVLIQGESGTGKELIARRIHQLSLRKGGPFLALNCAAYPQTLLESELFGHEKGAFTGATHARKGCFELASGGTLFLDEIGEIPLAAQVKLLRVLQFREIQRLGSETLLKVNVRVMAATSRNLRLEMERGNFREDLYYRLHVIPIHMPPLRERMSDLPSLVDHFLRQFSERSQKSVSEVRPRAMRVLLNHHWPGNVRELENVLEHALILAQGGIVDVGDLPLYLQEAGPSRLENHASLDEMEKQHLMKVLQECRGNKIQAAKRLNISRSTLYRKLEIYKLLDS